MNQENKNENDVRNSVGRKKLLWFLILLLVVFVSSPLLVRLFISIKMSDEVTNDWIGFFGNYFGTIISLGLSLYILYQNRIDNQENIRQEKEDNDVKLSQEKDQNQKSQNFLLQANRDIINNSVKPFVDAWHVEGAFGSIYAKDKKKYDYVMRDNNKFVAWIDYRKSSDYVWEKYFDTELVIENIGVGPIINLEVQFAGKGGGFFKSDERITINKEKGIIYRLFIWQHFISSNGNKIIFKYQDIYGNNYLQHIEFGARLDEDDRWILTKFEHISIQVNDV